MTYVPTWKERLEDAKRFIGPAVAVFVVLVLGGWLAWHEWWPRAKAKRPPAPPPKEEVALADARRRVSAEVDVLEKTFRRAVEAGESDAALTKMLDRVIARQRERVRLEPTGNAAESERLAGLEEQRGSLHTLAATARSEALEREAEAARAAGQAGTALDKLGEALRLQREANASVAPDRLKNLPRETRLAQMLESAAAAPARAAVDTALSLGRAALTRGDLPAALAAFADARARQVALNERYPGASLAGTHVLEEIDAEMASLSALGMAETSLAREREAASLVATGRLADAATLLAAAAALQREVNEKYPRSRAASKARVDELEVKRQTLLSTEPLARVAALDAEIRTLLRQRHAVAAGSKIAAATALLDKVAAEFPRSAALDAVLQHRLVYLGLRAAELGTLQEQVLAQLLPVPGGGGVAMLRGEVWQELFQRVMNVNPSRNAGRALPVDSVNWTEAREFCQRLGWVLGLRVRLPTEAEFRRVYEVDPKVWAAETSDARSHEADRPAAGTGRFADLAGNLAEWLEPATEAGETAPVAGGSYLDAVDSLRQLPVVTMARRERARHVGFRVVVELPAP